jgi:signal transduction histidine kinase
MKRFFFFILIFNYCQLMGQQVPVAGPIVHVQGFQSGQIAAGPVSYLTDSNQSSRFDNVRLSVFNQSYKSFYNALSATPARFTFWSRFSLTNYSDSTQRLYLFAGDINFIDLYIVSPGQKTKHIESGNLRPVQPEIAAFHSATPIIPMEIKSHEKTEVFIRLVQKTEEFSFDELYIYNKGGLKEAVESDYEDIHSFIVFQILFQGILICQILYVLLQWIIIKKREYAYYFLYLLAISVYFLSKYEKYYSVDILFSKYPLLTVYLNKTLLILPYYFYFRFIRSFLDMPRHYPDMNRWINRIENFLLVYLLFDLLLISTTFNVKLQREIYSYVIAIVFIVTACFIYYLFRQKKMLINYVLTGSLAVGIGNFIGLALTYLDDEGFLHGIPNKLIFSQIGIIIEIFCFTAGLSYKTMSAEKDKIRSQAKLIEQLKENEILQTKMHNIRNSIAQDLHDDIGSTLSSISILSNLAIKGNDATKTMNTIQEIKDSSVLLMEKMDDIVWSINPKNDSFENLLLRIKRFATSLFDAKNIDYHITISENIHEVKLPIEFRQHIFLILKEAINNLVKYSAATEAELCISYQGTLLEISLKDNGSGFDSLKPVNGNGLLSMRNRSEIIRGKLEIYSVMGQGTTVKLSLKIK